MKERTGEKKDDVDVRIFVLVIVGGSERSNLTHACAWMGCNAT